MPRRSLAGACLALGALLIATPHPRAQEAAGAQEQPPRFRTEASFVRVDVYPTRGGVPVTDLRADEFEVLEDGRPQRIESFEHVAIGPAGPEALRVEADSVREGERMAADPRRRVFVFFLDPAQVAVEGSHAIKEPVIRLIDRLLGPDDLIGFMTPHMSAAQITLGRKTEVVAEMLRENWTWGWRHRIMPMDQREMEYESCFPGLAIVEAQALAARLVERRRERMTLDALHDLVGYLGGIREERKAILAVTEGWALHRPDASLLALRSREPVPGRDPVGVDSWGTLRINPPTRGMDDTDDSQARCNRERMFLANIDNEDHFRRLLDMANRNNASFYPIDPRGLAVFDSPWDRNAPPIDVDMRRVSHKVEVLRTLAENTDGIAVVNSNDLDKGLRRIADDFSSYYLLGYYSTNPRLDGGYRRITVRVSRRGVDVRARRGYRAATREDLAAANAAAAAPVREHTRRADAALESLSRLRADQRFSIDAVPMRDTPAGPVTSIWVVGELLGSLGGLARGGTVEIELTGGVLAAVPASLQPGERSFIARIPVDGADAAVSITARLEADVDDELLQDAVRLEPDAPMRPLLFRRGAVTGNRLQPAADVRFSRTERLRLELLLTSGASPLGARFLDRTGQPLQVPVAVGERADADGRRWLTADAQLGALAPADYLVELTVTQGGSEHRVLTPLRVTR